MEKSFFLNKYCKLVTDTGFVISGTVIDIDELGFYFETDTQISYFTWAKISSLVPKI